MDKMIRLKQETYHELSLLLIQKKRKALVNRNYSAVNVSFDDLINELLKTYYNRSKVKDNV